MTHHAQWTIDNTRGADGQDDAQFAESWLRPVRVVWVTLALVAVVILATSLPGYFLPFDDHVSHLSPQETSVGGTVLSILSRLASLTSTLISLGLAWVLFRRRFEEKAAATLAFYLLVYAVVMAGPLEMWSAYWTDGVLLVAKLQGLLLATPTVVLLFLFPNGRFVPTWTGRLLLLTIPWNVSLFLLPGFDPVSLAAIPLLQLVFISLWYVSFLMIGMYAQFIRYRRVSSPAERQQTKWVLFGIVLWLVCVAMFSAPYLYLGTLPANSPTPWWTTASVSGWYLSLNIMPASLGVAVTRYRLWDIDVVINRTLVYTALTAAVIAIYVLIVGGVGALFQSQGNTATALVATGVVAVLFQPMRERLQQGVNRLLYGQRNEPFEVLSRLGRRIEDTFSQEALLSAIVKTVAQALKLPYVAVFNRGGETIVGFGTQPVDAETVPLVYQGAPVGKLLVGRRSPGEPFSGSEQGLLRNVAYQAGAAIYALQLTGDLRRARQQIVTSREEERRRLRRDLHDGLGPSLAAQLLKIGSASALLYSQPQETARLLSEMEVDLDSIIGDVRRIVYNLRPPALDQWGLTGALQVYADSCERSANGPTTGSLTIEVTAPETLPPLPAAVEVAAYHIGREGLTNVVRHARARHSVLRLSILHRREPALCLSIEDDGQGIIPNSEVAGNGTGVGLASMQERAEELGGSCVIESSPGHGTRLTAVLPLGEGFDD